MVFERLLVECQGCRVVGALREDDLNFMSSDWSIWRSYAQQPCLFLLVAATGHLAMQRSPICPWPHSASIPPVHDLVCSSGGE